MKRRTFGKILNAALIRFQEIDGPSVDLPVAVSRRVLAAAANRFRPAVPLRASTVLRRASASFKARRAAARQILETPLFRRAVGDCLRRATRRFPGPVSVMTIGLPGTLNSAPAHPHHIGQRTRIGVHAMNMVRTAMLLAFMTALFMAIGFMIGGTGGMLIALVIAARNEPVFLLERRQDGAPDAPCRRGGRPARHRNITASSSSWPTRADPAHAQGLSDQERPAQRLCHRPQPRKTPPSAATTGLLHRLSHEEVAGVMAHELAHVKHRDNADHDDHRDARRRPSPCSPNFAFFFRGARNNPLGIVGVLAAMILAPLAAGLVQMAISRNPRIFRRPRRRRNLRQSDVAGLGAREDRRRRARRVVNEDAERNPATAHMVPSSIRCRASAWTDCFRPIRRLKTGSPRCVRWPPNGGQSGTPQPSSPSQQADPADSGPWGRNPGRPDAERALVLSRGRAASKTSRPSSDTAKPGLAARRAGDADPCGGRRSPDIPRRSARSGQRQSRFSRPARRRPGAGRGPSFWQHFRHLPVIEAFLGSLVDRPLPEGRPGRWFNVLATAAAQILYLDTPDRAAVDPRRRTGARRPAQPPLRTAGQCRAAPHEPRKANPGCRRSKPVRSMHRPGFAERLQTAYGEAADAILRAHATPRPARSDDQGRSARLGRTARWHAFAHRHRPPCRT